jgi:hypothetical protein
MAKELCKGEKQPPVLNKEPGFIKDWWLLDHINMSKCIRTTGRLHTNKALFLLAKGHSVVSISMPCPNCVRGRRIAVYVACHLGAICNEIVSLRLEQWD